MENDIIKIIEKTAHVHIFILQRLRTKAKVIKILS